MTPALLLPTVLTLLLPAPTPTGQAAPGDADGDPLPPYAHATAEQATGELVTGIRAPHAPTHAHETPANDTTTPRVVILGTGTPNADPDRWGPAVAVVAGGRAYLVDAGAGVVRRAAAAARDHGIAALSPEGLDRLFITHLHSDHTVGLPDVILSPWVLDRPAPIRIVGPPGTESMVAHIEQAWREDIHMRLFGLEPRDANADAYRAIVAETTGGPVYEDENVRVTAIPVLHGSWPHPLGYRFEAGSRTIVISGDARPSESLAEACDGCDVLIHEVYSAEAFQRRPPEWQAYHARAHTSTVELADIARRARPELLVLYHQLYWGSTDDDLVREIREAGYGGRVVSASDLDGRRSCGPPTSPPATRRPWASAAPSGGRGGAGASMPRTPCRRATPPTTGPEPSRRPPASSRRSGSA